MLSYEDIKKYKNLAKMLDSSKAFTALIQELNTTYERVKVLNEKEAGNATMSENELSENKTLKIRKKELKTLITIEVNSFKESNENWISSNWDRSKKEIENQLDERDNLANEPIEDSKLFIPPSDIIIAKETATV